MRKLLVIIAISIAMPFNLHAQKIKKHEKYNFKQTQSEYIDFKKIDKESKIIRGNYNEYFKSNKENPEEIAWEYLQSNHAIYGLSKDLKEVKISRSCETSGGRYVYFSQYLNDILVCGTNITVYIDKENAVRYILNEFRDISKYRNIEKEPTIANNQILNIIQNYLSANEIRQISQPQLVYFESEDRGLELAWQINVYEEKLQEAWQFFISANDNNRIIHAQGMTRYATAKVYDTNPMASASARTNSNIYYGITNNYKDNTDANNSDLERELKEVTLQDVTLISEVRNGVTYYGLKGIVL